MFFTSLLLSIITFYIGIRSDLQSSDTQGGRTCAARPYERHSFRSGKFDTASGTSLQALAILDSSDSASCYYSLQNAKLYLNDDENTIARDSLEAFVETCYAQPFSWEAFGYLNASMSGADRQSWLTFKDWVFKVLYLNPDTIYYCQAVKNLLGVFDYLDSNGADMKDLIAVEKYYASSGKCPYLNTDSSLLAQQWHEAYLRWQDTVKDSLLTPFDSTLPTLQQIGFQILLGPQYAVEHNGTVPTSVLGLVELSPNPFVDNAIISYTLNVPATLTVEVYNTLGKKVLVPVPSVFTSNGDYSLTLSGSALASGLYYVRFSVLEGEVKTIKVSKE